MVDYAFVAKLWNLCNVLRDDGIVYHKYISELTYLLFLKLAQNNRTEDLILNGCHWSELVSQKESDVLAFYRIMLTRLGEESRDPLVREIFSFPTTVFSHPENLYKVVRAIDAMIWVGTKVDGFGQLYEELLQRNALESRSGAGQYFTPRPLVDCLVSIMKPALGELIQDPTCGTGGFLVSADNYIRSKNNNNCYAENPPRYSGVEIERDTYRLCLMNLFLHDMDGSIIHGDALTRDALGLSAPNVVLANPPFGSSGGGARPRRTDLSFVTSNKQLLFLHHICETLGKGGRAAVIVPDNVLFEGGVGRKIRVDLMEKCRVQVILRLPKGIFYAAGVNTSVMIFNKEDSETEGVWLYDLRSGMPRFTKGRPINREHFSDFEEFWTDLSRDFTQQPSGDAAKRAKYFSRQEIAEHEDTLLLPWNFSHINDDDDSGGDLVETITALEEVLASTLKRVSELGAVLGETRIDLAIDKL